MATAEVSLLSEVMRQAPSLGVALAVGYFIFKAYQKLVAKLMDVIEASTGAITANTAVMKSLATLIDAMPGKVAHEIKNLEHARAMTTGRQCPVCKRQTAHYDTVQNVWRCPCGWRDRK
jgi:site-specific recombinase